MKRYDLVIAGGGIAGSAMAIVMGHAGKAVLLLEPLVASDPPDLRARYLLAHAYGFQAAACPDGSPQALDLLRKALKMSQSLTALNPDNPTYNVATAGSYSELGSALQASGDLPGALEKQRRAAVMFGGKWRLVIP
jgi:choline dehydrogenase-like flavoprotein